MVRTMKIELGTHRSYFFSLGVGMWIFSETENKERRQDCCIFFQMCIFYCYLSPGAGAFSTSPLVVHPNSLQSTRIT
jgi:hypothetical protein